MVATTTQGLSALRHPRALESFDDPLISAKDMSRVFSGPPSDVVAVDNVSLEIERNKFTAFLGASKSGKSTLLHCFSGFDTANSDLILLDRVDISGLRRRALAKLRREKVGFIFQTLALEPTLTARENIFLPGRLSRMNPDRSRITDFVNALGLANRLDNFPSALSASEKQLVAFARAFATVPQIIFADEPTRNLDTDTAKQVLHFLRESVDRFGQSVIMATTSVKAAASADRVLFLDHGKIVAEMSDPTPDSIHQALLDLGSEDGPTSELPTTTSSIPWIRPLAAEESPDTEVSESMDSAAADVTEVFEVSIHAREGQPSLEELPIQEEPPLPSFPPAPEEPPITEETPIAVASEPILPDDIPSAPVPLEEALDQIAPTQPIPAATALVIDKAQQILGHLPGSVVTETPREP